MRLRCLTIIWRKLAVWCITKLDRLFDLVKQVLRVDGLVDHFCFLKGFFAGETVAAKTALMTAALPASPGFVEWQFV